MLFGEDRMCHGGADATLAPCHATNACRIARSIRTGAPTRSASPTRTPPATSTTWRICAYMETARLTFMRDMGMMAPREDGMRGISAGMTVSFLAESHWPGQVELGTGVLQDRHQLDHRRLGRLQGRPLHRRGRDDGGPAQGQDAPSDRRPGCGQRLEKYLACQAFSTPLDRAIVGALSCACE